MIPSTTVPRREDIVITAFPYTDLTGSKRRPALFLGGDPSGGDVILVFISSVARPVLSAYDLLLDPSHPDFAATGLKVSSVLRLDKIATVARRLVTRRIDQLGSSWQAQADQTLVAVPGIDTSRYATAERARLAAVLSINGLEALIAAISK